MRLSDTQRRILEHMAKGKHLCHTTNVPVPQAWLEDSHETVQMRTVEALEKWGLILEMENPRRWRGWPRMQTYVITGVGLVALEAKRR